MTGHGPTEMTIWAARKEDVGDAKVLRALPARTAQNIGPFVLLDHFGPMPSFEGKLPAHPHAGIEVMTYLIAGANVHHDSAGNVGRIGSGGAQWMRAGSGILHSETNLIENEPIFHGLQIWARLPKTLENADPEYRNIDSAEIPEWTREGAAFRLLSGKLDSYAGPIETGLPSIMLDIQLSSNSKCDIEIPLPDHCYGVYVISGTPIFHATDFEATNKGDVVCLPPATTMVSVTNQSDVPARLFLLGGEPAPQPLVFGGPFVYDSDAAIHDAQTRFKNGDMGRLDGIPF